MHAKSKKILITTESREIFILRTEGRSDIRGFCPKCAVEVEMLTLDAITSQTGKRTRELFQLIENNSIHSIEATTGHLLVCRYSLKEIDGQKLINGKRRDENEEQN